MTLRDYQQTAVDWAKSYSGLIIAPAGSGKTVIAAHILKFWLADNAMRAGWLAPTRETCEQGMKAAELAGVGYRVTVRCPHESVDFSDCGILIVDECFPPNTQVSGKQISNLKPGDFVDSFNHKENRVEKRKVISVFKTRHNASLCCVNYSGTSVCCTPNHPFWNGCKYVPANMLDYGDLILTIPPHESGVLPCVQNRNPKSGSLFNKKASNLFYVFQGFKGFASEAIESAMRLLLRKRRMFKPETIAPKPRGREARESLLQRKMQGPIGVEDEFGKDVGNEQKDGGSHFRMDEGSNGFSSDTGKTVSIFEENWTSPDCSRREWNGANCGAAQNQRAVWFSNGTRSPNGWVRRSIGAKLLQGGFSLFGNKTGNRSGWFFSLFNKSKKIGYQKRGGAVESWVDSVEVFKRGDPEWVKQMGGENFVYNISVEGNENYFVGTGGDRVLVHNCKHSPAETWAKCIRSCPGIKYGFDATPWHDSDIERNAELRKIFPRTFEITREQVGESLADSRLIWRDDTDNGLEKRIDQNIEKLMSVRGKYMRITKEELNAMCAWESIVDIGICQNTARNEACIEYAKQNPDSQRLVLVPRVTLGEEYQRRIPGSLLLHSGVPRKPRREAVNAFRAGDLKCIVATSLADEGLDLPNAEILVMVSGGRSSQKTIQRASRVLRSFPGKKLATILDFADRFHPIAARQAQKRMSSYRKLGCMIESGVKFVVTK